MLCEMMDVSRSAYYAWCTRGPSERDQSNAQLDRDIRRIYKAHKGRYGSPRIQDELNDEGKLCSVARVARRMKRMGLKAVQTRAFKVTTNSKHNKPVYPDLLERDTSTTAVNQKWVSDISYLRTTEGWLYLAVVMDLYSRAVIGWSMQSTMTAQLVCDALIMALFRRGFPKGVIVHSDRGAQYCSKVYRKLIRNHQLFGSMGKKGCCYDNAVIESFFHSLKVEAIYPESVRNRNLTRNQLFEYMEVYYNQQRKHSAIGFQTPKQFENQSMNNQALLSQCPII